MKSCVDTIMDAFFFETNETKPIRRQLTHWTAKTFSPRKGIGSSVGKKYNVVVCFLFIIKINNVCCYYYYY